MSLVVQGSVLESAEQICELPSSAAGTDSGRAHPHSDTALGPLIQTMIRNWHF